MKTAIYIRVSTEEQAQEGYSISAQKQKLNAYCVAQDWEVVGFYVDEGISAKDMNRPQLQQMMKDIESGSIECVLVYRLDRLTRSVLDLYKLLGLFEKYNCKFKSATEVFETTTALGRMFITIVAAMAQWERENTGERVRMGLQEKVRQGKYAHNQRPFGYYLNLRTGELTINEEEAKIVRLIVKLYLGGLGVNRVCQYLNERNLRTRDGNQWNDTPMMQLLKNPLYAGTIRWGGIVSENVVPPIIDLETYEEIQRTIDRRRSLKPKHISSDYIFSGKLKCPNCNNSLVGRKSYAKKPVNAVYKSYTCNKKKSGECIGTKNFSERKIDKAFLLYISQFGECDDLLKEIAVSAEEANESEVNYEELEKELEVIKQRKKKWQYAWSRNMISDEDLTERMEEERKLEEEMIEQMNLFQQQEKTMFSKEELYESLKDLSKSWSVLEDDEKKNFVQTFIKQIHFGYKNNTVYVQDIDFY